MKHRSRFLLAVITSIMAVSLRTADRFLEAA